MREKAVAGEHQNHRSMIGIGENMAGLVRILDQPDEWAFVPTKEGIGSKPGSYGSTWDSGEELGLECPVPIGISGFLQGMKERGVECADRCPS